MKKADYLSILLCMTGALLFTGCNPPFISPGPVELTINLHMDKNEYDYAEIIKVTLETKYDPSRDIRIRWTLDRQVPPFPIHDPANLSFYLTPETTTSYALRVTVSDGYTARELHKQFTVLL